MKHNLLFIFAGISLINNKDKVTHIDIYDTDDVLFGKYTEHTTATLSILPRTFYLLAFLGFFIYISNRKWQKLTVLSYISSTSVMKETY